MLTKYKTREEYLEARSARQTNVMITGLFLLFVLAFSFGYAFRYVTSKPVVVYQNGCVPGTDSVHSEIPNPVINQLIEKMP